MSDGETTGTAPAPKAPDRQTKQGRGRALIAAVVAVVALAVVGVAFVYAGGPSFISDLVGTGTPTVDAAAAGTGGSSDTATLPAGVDEDLAARMYVEQIESAENLTLMSEGKFVSFTIGDVAKDADAADVAVTAKLADGTSAPGAMRFVKRAGNWYFFAITGMRPDATGGLADTIGNAAALEASETLEKEMSDAGITTVDRDVAATIASQQAANQEMVAGIIDGTFTSVKLGEPVDGAGTVSVPVTLSGKGSEPVAGKVLLVRKVIDGEERIFLTTFQKG